MSGKLVKNPSDIPTKEHWAILEYTTIAIPGYDRGDPPDTESIIRYHAFDTKEEVEAWIHYQTTPFSSPKNFSVIFVTPARAIQTVRVEVTKS